MYLYMNNKKLPTEESPEEKLPTEKSPEEKLPTEELPAEESSEEELPAEELPVKELPVKKNPPKKSGSPPKLIIVVNYPDIEEIRETGKRRIRRLGLSRYNYIHPWEQAALALYLILKKCENENFMEDIVGTKWLAYITDINKNLKIQRNQTVSTFDNYLNTLRTDNYLTTLITDKEKRKGSIHLNVNLVCLFLKKLCDLCDKHNINIKYLVTLLLTNPNEKPMHHGEHIDLKYNDEREIKVIESSTLIELDRILNKKYLLADYERNNNSLSKIFYKLKTGTKSLLSNTGKAVFTLGLAVVTTKGGKTHKKLRKKNHKKTKKQISK